MKIFALYSIKGGVGKTAAAVNFAYLSARDGFRTLLCDLDPQGSASFYFRIRPRKKFSSKKLLKGGVQIERNIRGTDFENLDLLPADLSFRKLDVQLANKKHSKSRLDRLFEPFADEYDHVFLDCPPNITLLSENVFRVADLLLVPLIPTTLSVLTYDKLLTFFKKQSLSRRIITPFFSMVEQRKRLHRETMADLVDNERFLKSWIPYLSEVEKMGLTRMPVVASAPESAAAAAYNLVWREICGRIEITRPLMPE